jgi:hypothetical protein
MIRSWGFLQAFTAGSEFTLSLDDDVRPQGDLFEAYERGFNTTYPLSEYLDVGGFTTSALQMRGYPYKDRGKEVVVQYGGWSGVPDLDATTQINHPRHHTQFYTVRVPVPKYAPVTCCAMNFAFRTKWTPMMFQFPLYEGNYNRFGDIWSGLVQKSVLDALDRVMLINGEAGVLHERASDPFVNLQKEASGLPHNEDIWRAIHVPESRGQTMISAYCDAVLTLADHFTELNPGYAKHLEECLYKWLSLFP